MMDPGREARRRVEAGEHSSEPDDPWMIKIMHHRYEKFWEEKYHKIDPNATKNNI